MKILKLIIIRYFFFSSLCFAQLKDDSKTKNVENPGYLTISGKITEKSSLKA
jgi:hypothetical protein